MSEMADQQKHLLISGHLPSLPGLKGVWEDISQFFPDVTIVTQVNKFYILYSSYVWWRWQKN